VFEFLILDIDHFVRYPWDTQTSTCWLGITVSSPSLVNFYSLYSK